MPPSSTPASDAGKPAHEASEAEFLKRQAADARAALSRVCSEAAAKLGQGVNPVAWAKEFPWITLGASAVAGFVATAMIVPTKEQQALNKLAAIERALNPSPPPKPKVEAAVDGDDHAKAYKPASHSFTTMLTRELIGAVKPAIISLLTAGVTAKAAKPSEEEMEAAAANEGVKEQQAGAR